MNDGGIRTELGRIVGHPIVEPGTDGQDHVGMMHGHIGLIGTVHAEHAETLAIVAGKSAQPHEGVGHREIE